MVWLSMVSLSIGALLSQRFKIIALVPATVAVLVIDIGAGIAQGSSAWLVVGMITAASVSMQAGYLVGMLIQHGVGAFLASRSSPFSHTTSARRELGLLDRPPHQRGHSQLRSSEYPHPL
jgi:hypothetical protein